MKRFTRVFKEWLLQKLEPWYEERAAMDLAWFTFVRKYGTTGKRPAGSYSDWVKSLHPLDKLNYYDECEVDPDYLQVIIRKQHEDRTASQKKHPNDPSGAGV